MFSATTKLQTVSFRLVTDAHYEEVISRLAARSRRWFLANVFIVDTRSSRGKAPAVVHLVQALADAIQRGVLVRVIIGGSDSNFSLSDTAFSSQALFRSLGVPCTIASTRGKSSHKKLVVADDCVLLGSHNWSEGAWKGQRQDSILVKDAGFAALMGNLVRAEWQDLAEVK